MSKISYSFATKFTNTFNSDNFHAILLPRFNTNYPISCDRISTAYIHQPLAESTYDAYQMHSHSYYELHFLLSGEICHRAKNNTSRVSAGSWLLIPKNYPHKVINYQPKTLICAFHFNISSEPSFYTYAFKNCFQSPSFLSGSITEEQLKLLRKVIELPNEAPMTLLSLQNDILRMIIDFATALPRSSNFSAKTSSEDVRYLMALEYIHDNILKPISVNEIAGSIYLSSRQLNRLFQKNMGTSVNSYILKKKIDKSRELLQISNEPLATIAQRLGFSDEYYFNRFFKKYCNITPHQYRLQFNSKKSENQNPSP